MVRKAESANVQMHHFIFSFIFSFMFSLCSHYREGFSIYMIIYQNDKRENHIYETVYLELKY